MIVDLLWLLAPRPAAVLEEADHLTLLSIHADDRLGRPFEPVTRAFDGQELSVSSGAVPAFMPNTGFDILAIRLEREAHLVQQPRPRVGADLDTEADQLLGNLLGGLAGPAQAVHRIAGDLVLEQLFYARSEEHTSELQSLRHLVCRLLLEKKKNTMIHSVTTSTPRTIAC